MNREIIKVNVTLRRIDSAAGAADVVAVAVFSDGKGGEAFKQLDKALKGGLSQVLALGDFKGEANTTAVVYGNKATGARRDYGGPGRPQEGDGGHVASGGRAGGEHGGGFEGEDGDSDAAW